MLGIAVYILALIFEDVQYINLEIKIEETFRKRKLVVETYRKTYLLSSFFSDIFFYKPDFYYLLYLSYSL